MHLIGGIWRTETPLGPGPKSAEAERLKGSGVETKTASLEYDWNMLQNFHKSLQSVKRINVTSVCHGERERKMMMHDDLRFYVLVQEKGQTPQPSFTESNATGCSAPNLHAAGDRRQQGACSLIAARADYKRFVCRSQTSRNKRIELAVQGRFLEYNWQLSD